MKASLLARLACPRCRAALRVEIAEQEDAEITRGSLRCVACASTYTIEGGLPQLVVDVPRARETQKSFGAQWRGRLEGRFEEDTLFGLTREEEQALFFESVGLRAEDLLGKWVLDGGCGSGRLTRGLVAHGASVVGLDLSPTIRHLALQHRAVANLHFVQGSVLDIPFADDAFDVVWSMGVIHHTGDTPRAFRSLARVVRPGGRLYVWVYCSRQLTLYKLIRDAMQVSHRIPKGLLFYLCYMMAPPLKVYHAGKFALRRIRKKPITARERRESTIRTIAFELHDDLAPPYQTRHTPEELLSWFREARFGDLEVVGEVGVRGTKAV